jgi:hypothetical protein
MDIIETQQLFPTHKLATRRLYGNHCLPKAIFLLPFQYLQFLSPTP